MGRDSASGARGAPDRGAPHVRVAFNPWRGVRFWKRRRRKTSRAATYVHVRGVRTGGSMLSLDLGASWPWPPPARRRRHCRRAPAGADRLALPPRSWISPASLRSILCVDSQSRCAGSSRRCTVPGWSVSIAGSRRPSATRRRVDRADDRALAIGQHHLGVQPGGCIVCTLAPRLEDAQAADAFDQLPP